MDAYSQAAFVTYVVVVAFVGEMVVAAFYTMLRSSC